MNDLSQPLLCVRTYRCVQFCQQSADVGSEGAFGITGYIANRYFAFEGALSGVTDDRFGNMGTAKSIAKKRTITIL